MWCPRCKIEYIPSITICSECGADLKEQLPNDVPLHKLLFQDYTKERETEFSPSWDNEPLFIDTKSKLEDVKATAYAFTAIGFSGIILIILILFEQIPLKIINEYIRYVMCFMFGILFLFLFAIGIRYFLQLRDLSLQMEQEQERTRNISRRLFSNITGNMIDSDVDILVSDTSEQIYFKRSLVIKRLLLYIDPTITDAYADYLVDLFYNRLFPDL